MKISKSHLSRTIFFDGLFQNSRHGIVCVRDSQTVEFDLAPMNELVLYEKYLGQFFRVLRDMYPVITLANTENNAGIAYLIDYFQVKRTHYTYLWSDGYNISYSNTFNHEEFCSNVVKLRVFPYCSIFMVPMRCEYLSISHSEISKVIGESERIDAGGCDHLDGIFGIPERCLYVNISRSSITGITGLAKEISLVGCENLPATSGVLNRHAF